MPKDVASLPSRVQVGPLVYTVVVDDDLVRREGEDHGAKLSGFSDHSAQRIGLRVDMGPDAQAETVVHELLHCLTSMTGLLDELGEEDEERVVNRLSPALLDTIRRNPDLVSYLTADGEG